MLRRRLLLTNKNVTVVAATPPVNTVYPEITGNLVVGSLLTCSQGTWNGTPPISYIYSWYRNGTPISGVTLNTYTPVIADVGKTLLCLVDVIGPGGVSFAASNSVVINAFESSMDLINLQSYDSSKFTIVSSKISAWTEQNGSTQWTQSNAANRPTLSSGKVNSAGNGVNLIRASDVSATVYTAYFVLRNVSETQAKALFAAKTDTDWMGLPNNVYKTTLNVGGGSRYAANTGYKGKRDIILSIRRNGNTCSIYVNNRKALETANTFSGQATKFGQLFCIAGFTSFGFEGTFQAMCVSSSYLSESAHQSNINQLYALYNLGANTAVDSILGFGDSNTSGQGVDSYLVSLANSMGLAYANLGIVGSLYTNVGATANNGYDRYESNLISTPNTDYVVIQYGTNDILSSVSSTTFGTQLRAKIAQHIAAGISPSKICLCSVPYQQSGSNATALNNYRTEVLGAATTYGTKYFDLLQDMRDNGGNSLLSDSVHLNATGQARWAAGVLAALTS